MSPYPKLYPCSDIELECSSEAKGPLFPENFAPGVQIHRKKIQGVVENGFNEFFYCLQLIFQYNKKTFSLRCVSGFLNFISDCFIIIIYPVN